MSTESITTIQSDKARFTATNSGDNLASRPRLRSALGMRADAAAILVLLAVVTLVWVNHYNLWSSSAWKTPVTYVQGESWDIVPPRDGLWGMAVAKATAAGEIPPLLPKYPTSLGAPYGANWNDWPTFEEAINAWWALLVRAFGLFKGSNLALLSAHLLAALSFYAVCRYLRYSIVFAVAGAALFALSRYAFWRNLPHLSLTFYWHFPLGLLVVWWCIQQQVGLRDRGKLAVCAAVAVAFGFQNAYYSALFMQLLCWAALFCFLQTRAWRSVILPVSVAGVLFASLVVVNLDTLYSWWVHGSNTGAAPRTYFDVEWYALRPVELLLPRSHVIGAIGEWTNRVFFTANVEGGSPYLGIVGIGSAVLLAFTTARALAAKNLWQAPVHFWGVVLVGAFSVVGGINALIALFGFQLFRCTNRYSITLLAILLLFLVRQLTIFTRNASFFAQSALAVLLLAVGIYDQVPPRFPERQVAAERTRKDFDRLMSRIEDRLPVGAMLFEYPARDFPEGGMVGQMDDYEELRPFLHSEGLRFSFGDIKGRYRNRWRKEIGILGVENGVKLMERYGFAAVLVNRQAYDDGGHFLLERLRAEGAHRVLARSRQWLCVALNPSRHPSLPPLFGKGWFELEGEPDYHRRWSSGEAELILHNSDATPRSVRLVFGLSASSCRRVDIYAEGQRLHSGEVDHEQMAEPLELDLSLQPGDNTVRFVTDRPAELVFNSDSRKLAFAVTNFRVVADSDFDDQQPLR